MAVTDGETVKVLRIPDFSVLDRISSVMMCLLDSTGKKTHLFNGVCSASACPAGPPTGCVDCKYANWDYTLVQPLEQ